MTARLHPALLTSLAALRRIAPASADAHIRPLLHHMGAVNGRVWQSPNAGISWANGTGIYRPTDGGETWQEAGPRAGFVSPAADRPAS